VFTSTEAAENEMARKVLEQGTPIQSPAPSSARSLQLKTPQRISRQMSRKRKLIFYTLRSFLYHMFIFVPDEFFGV